MPDPRSQQADALLKSVQQQRGGQLKIFLGASPGVGKTCAMLNAARERAAEGVRLLVGLVETHGRVDTQAFVAELPLLPRKELIYQGQTLSEFDLDAALAAKPQLILVDELAHSNIPGSRHQRRYQDIAELLEAGIDVYTTMNIQHVESLNDLVKQVTGVRVRETVPDQFIDQAQQLVFIDVEPAHLLQRLAQGKVYIGEFAEQAKQQFFQKETLTALRDMAVRLVMRHVDSQLLTEQQAKARQRDYQITDKLLVLITNRRDQEHLIRAGRRIAEKRQVPWIVIWVDTGAIQGQTEQLRLQSAFSLARELGAETEILRGPSTFQMMSPYVIEHAVSTVLVGSSTRRRVQWWRQPLYQQLVQSDLPLEVIVSPDLAPAKPVARVSPTLGQRAGYGAGCLAVMLASAVAMLLRQILESGNLVLIYVMAVVLCGLRYGARPAIFTALLSFFAFNYFLTEPYFTLSVHKSGDIATLIFMLVIGMVCGPAASKIRQQLLLLRAANRSSEFQRDFAARLTVVRQTDELWQILRQQLHQALQCPVHLVWSSQGQWHTEPIRAWSPLELAMLEWTQRHNAMAGRFSETLNGSRWTAMPLAANGQVVAILCFESRHEVLRADDHQLITSLLQQAASVWQRIAMGDALESSRVKAEMEQLRSALLSSVSHDLRSPLSAMMGSAESLKLLFNQLDETDRTELIDTILSESQRLDRYIQNLLDMTRLGHGELKLQRDWIEVSDLIASCRQRLKRFFPNQELVYQQVDELPPLYAHAALLEQALFNILENAARFSPEGATILIQVSQHSDQCCIEIEDQGPGIPAADREKVFDMFYIVADGDSKKHNTGMGLAICRGMIGAHGGSVRAEQARSGQGSCFIVELPLPKNDALPNVTTNSETTV